MQTAVLPSPSPLNWQTYSTLPAHSAVVGCELGSPVGIEDGNFDGLAEGEDDGAAEVVGVPEGSSLG